VATAVPGTNWLLVVALDNGDATSGMRSLLKASAISLVILALLSGAIVHFLIARLLKRLSDIRDAMHNIANGTNDLSSACRTAARMKWRKLRRPLTPSAISCRW
jgi:methyl-accepting chemotaxis protein